MNIKNHLSQYFCPNIIFKKSLLELFGSRIVHEWYQRKKIILRVFITIDYTYPRAL